MIATLKHQIIPMRISNDELSGIIHHTPWPLNAIGCTGTEPLCFVPGFFFFKQKKSQHPVRLQRYVARFEDYCKREGRDLRPDFDELPQAAHTPIDQTTYRN